MASFRSRIWETAKAAATTITSTPSRTRTRLYRFICQPPSANHNGDPDSQEGQGHQADHHRFQDVGGGFGDGQVVIIQGLGTDGQGLPLPDELGESVHHQVAVGPGGVGVVHILQKLAAPEPDELPAPVVLDIHRQGKGAVDVALLLLIGIKVEAGQLAEGRIGGGQELRHRAVHIAAGHKALGDGQHGEVPILRQGLGDLAVAQIRDQDEGRKYEVQALISTSKANLENYKKQERQIGQEVQNTISELDSSRIKKSEIAKTFQEIDNKHNKLIKQIEAGAKQKEEANKKIEDYEKSIQMYTNDMRIKESRLKFLIETEKEKEGYIRSVKSLLKDCEQIKELGKGMHGVLANIIEVSEEYETAIEMCLGASLQNIVTDSEQDAKRLVEHLRKNKLGRASFLPISSVRGKKLTTIKGKENGVIGIASDLVKYSKKYEQIIISLLGRTVIVDTMENAIKVAKQNSYSFRIITIEGDVINPSGAITGGFVAKKTVNILGRGREIEKLEKEIKALKKKIENTKEKEEEFKKSINHILEASKEQEKELQEMEITYATEKQKMVSIEEEVSKLEKRIEKLKKDKVLAGENQEKCVKEEEKFNAEITKINEENEKLNAQIKEFADLNKDDQKYIDNLNEDITNLRISVSSFDESEMSIQEMEERINQDIENAKTSIEHKENEIENLKQSNIDLDKKVEEINKQIEQIRKDVSNSGNKVENLKQERIEENEKLEKLEDEISEVRNVIENLNAQIVKGDAKQSKLEENIQEITDKMWEEYELTPNNVTEYKKPDNVAKTGKRVNELRRKIRDLGSVNVDSIEEYKTLKQRYDFMCEQRLDLESTMAKLRNIVSDMTGIMKKQFKEKFKEINKNFVEVFKELFGGGKAALKLEDENNILECGIEITVQPPGKKLTNMLQLSGGERAFAAIALLFAILKINPSPFCVLDEIEAALDDVNVYRFADYLKNFSKDTQFLVITHRKGTMEAADTVYGVTMEEKGISKLLSIKLKS